MLKTVVVLPSGKEVMAGDVTKDTIISCEISESVNSEKNLKLGSTCTDMVELTLWSRYGALNIEKGDELIIYKENSAGDRTKMGVYTVDNRKRPSFNTLEMVCYDHVKKLDKDLSAWAGTAAAQNKTLLQFAKAVCAECGVTLKTTSIPNQNLPLFFVPSTEVTGRKFMQWVGELCGRFCHANPDGELELTWYTPSGVTITSDGLNWHFKGDLEYEDYQTLEIQSVNLLLRANYDRRLYGGVPLPVVPRWNEETYPWGCVIRVYNGYELWAFSAQATVFEKDGYTFCGVQEGCKAMYIGRATENNAFWIENNTAFENHTGKLMESPADLIWSNGSIWDSINETAISFDEPISAREYYVPELVDGQNAYIIKDNQLIETYAGVVSQEEILPYLETIRNNLAGFRYTPCKISLPARADLRAGHSFQFIDRYANTYTSIVMEKVQKGQKDTIESTGEYKLTV